MAEFQVYDLLMMGKGEFAAEGCDSDDGKWTTPSTIIDVIGRLSPAMVVSKLQCSSLCFPGDPSEGLSNSIEITY